MEDDPKKLLDKKFLMEKDKYMNLIMDDVHHFAKRYRGDPLSIAAALVAVARAIYVDVLGPNQAEEMFKLFADTVRKYEKEKTLH